MKDPLSSRPLAPDDVERVVSAAEAVTLPKRAGAADPFFCGRIVRIMLTFGPHVSVLSGGWRRRTIKDTGEITRRFDECLRSSDLRFEGGQLYLAWRRPKTGKPVLIPVPADMAPWLGAFLDKPRWGRRQSYNEMLERVEAELVKRGTPIKLAPTRFRHTAAVRLRRMGLLDEDIQEFLAISPQTMKHYINRPLEERTADLKAKGWDRGTLT